MKPAGRYGPRRVHGQPSPRISTRRGQSDPSPQLGRRTSAIGPRCHALCIRCGRSCKYFYLCCCDVGAPPIRGGIRAPSDASWLKRTGSAHLVTGPFARCGSVRDEWKAVAPTVEVALSPPDRPSGELDGRWKLLVGHQSVDRRPSESSAAQDGGQAQEFSTPRIQRSVIDSRLGLSHWMASFECPLASM